MQIIGIDIGTTSICGTVIDAKSGALLQSKTVNSEAFIESKYSWEKLQSPEKIIKIATEILDSLISTQTVCIGVTGQMHGIVYTDINGIAISPLYTWQDGRGNLEYKKNLTYAKYLDSYTGYGNVTDFYNRENSIRPKDAISYCTIQDYFVMYLCSLKKAIMHTSNAASFGNFDLEEKKFKINCDINISDNYAIAGKYKGIPVSLAIGDNQASVLSSITEKDVLINIGTGSQISIISDKIIEMDGLETRPFFENKYLIVGSALCGGRAYAILKDFYRKIFNYINPLTDSEIYEIMGKMVENAALPLKVDTRFSGTRANEKIKGSITGITEENFTPEALSAGVLEGMIDELIDMYNLMSASKTGLVGSGNAIRKNKFLIKVAEQKIGTKMRVPRHTEEAAVGAAIYAGLAVGIYENMKQAANTVIKYL